MTEEQVSTIYSLYKKGHSLSYLSYHFNIPCVQIRKIFAEYFPNEYPPERKPTKFGDTTCNCCGNIFHKTLPTSKYCSMDCRHLGRKGYVKMAKK